MTDSNVIFVDNNNLQWVQDNLQQWGLLLGYDLKRIWTDENYVYAATVSGLEVIEISSEKKIAFIDRTINGGFSSVWANDDKIFLGTVGNETEEVEADGIKYIEKTCVSGTEFMPADLITCLAGYIEEPFITNNDIRYIHGNGDLMCACTISGVDVIGISRNSFHSSILVNNAYKCFMTSTGKFYYLLNYEDEIIHSRWDNLNKGDYIALTNTGLTTTKISSIYTWTESSVRSLHSVNAEKYYFEFIPNNITGSCLIGVCTSSANLDYYCGRDVNSWGFSASTGNIHHNGITYSYGSSWDHDNVIGVALDMDNGQIWFSIDGVWQNGGMPASGTGAAFSGLVGNYLYIMTSYYAPNQTATINFGRLPFNYSPPTGFNSGFGVHALDAWGINIVNVPDFDWYFPDNVHAAGGGILPPGVIINNFFVTEHTAQNGIDNTIYVAMSEKLYIIDEGNFTADTINIPSIYKGDYTDFTVVWANDKNIYATLADAFFIFNLSDYHLVEYYGLTDYGEAHEFLLDDVVIDINITEGI